MAYDPWPQIVVATKDLEDACGKNFAADLHGFEGGVWGIGAAGCQRGFGGNVRGLH